MGFLNLFSLSLLFDKLPPKVRRKVLAKLLEEAGITLSPDEVAELMREDEATSGIGGAMEGTTGSLPKPKKYEVTIDDSKLSGKVTVMAFDEDDALYKAFRVLLRKASKVRECE